MRKQSFLFIAGAALLALASCQPNTNETAPDQAQIDSMVNARVEELRLEMLAQNDSLINALAIQKADSIVAAMKGGSTPARKPTASKPPVKETPKPTTPGQKDRNNQTTVDQQKQRNNDASIPVEQQKKRNNQ